jgi:hypothetical protein
MMNTMIHYGVVAGSGTPFWGWLEGSGLTHVWTSQEMADIETKLGTVDTILFDHAFPRLRHPVRSASTVLAVVWYHDPWEPKVPAGWQVQSVCFSHSALGGITDGCFWVHLGTRVECSNLAPRAAVGVCATLWQILDPTICRDTLALAVIPQPGTAHTSVKVCCGGTNDTNRWWPTPSTRKLPMSRGLICLGAFTSNGRAWDSCEDSFG